MVNNAYFFGDKLVVLTRFEKARLLSARTLQLSLGAPAMVKAIKSARAEEIAKLELEKGVLPLVVLREFPGGQIQRIELQ